MDYGSDGGQPAHFGRRESIGIALCHRGRDCGVAWLGVQQNQPAYAGSGFFFGREGIVVQTVVMAEQGFLFGVFTLFLYVAAQTGINSFFINYVTEGSCAISAQAAGLILSFGGMGLFLIGRLAGSSLMKFVTPGSMLAVCASAAIACMGLVMMELGSASVVALCAVYLFESIMFPTIFAMALLKANGNTEQASSVLIMSIVGGAIAPMLMGYIGQASMALGFVVPLICFIEILVYAMCNRIQK